MISFLLGRWLDANNLYLIHRLRGSSIGDALTATAFMRGVHEKTNRRFIVVSKYPEIFHGNPLVERHISVQQLGAVSRPILKAVLRHARHTAIGEHGYRPPRHFTEDDIASDHRRRISETQFCGEALERQWRLQLDYSKLRPEIYFSTQETENLKQKFRLPARYAVIRPVGPTEYTPNRGWGFDRFQEVVRRTPWITWVQPGPPHEPRVVGAIDLCGNTSLRELFFIIKNAQAVLSIEGLTNHVAAAFEVPSYVVFSGFSHVELALYPATIPIVRSPQVSCAPCWKRKPCPVPGKPCTSDISVEQVLEVLGERMVMPKTV